MGTEIEIRGHIPPEKRADPHPYTEMNVYYYDNNCVLDSRETGYDLTEFESDIIAGIKGCYEKHLDEEKQEQQRRFDESLVSARRKRQEEYMERILASEEDRRARLKRREIRQSHSESKDKPSAVELFEFISGIVLIIVCILAGF